MDGFTRYAGMLRDGSNLFLGGHADFCQCDRQSDLQAEVLHFIKFLLGRALQNELYQSFLKT